MIICNNLSYQKSIRHIHNATKKNVRRLAVMGPDGSGKTTLLRLCVKIFHPTTGNIIFPELDPEVTFYSQVGYLPQKTGLYDDLTIIENIEFYAKLKNVDLVKKYEWRDFLLNTARLYEFQNRKVSALSGGMRQKCALLCAVLSEPKLLILDEPTVGVDLRAKQDIWKMIELLHDRMSVIWATADAHEAQQCEELWMLDHGAVIFADHPKILTQTIKNPIYRSNDLTKALWRKDFLSDLFSDNVVEGSLDLNGTRMIVHPERIGNIPDTWEQLKPTLDDAMLATYAHLQSPLKRELTLSDREDRSLQYHDLDLIRVENLKKMYGNFCAVSPLNFTVKRGEIFGLLGPNGSGKSTTFKMLCGLETPTSGNAYILGKSISPLDINTRMKIGYMPQKFSLYRLLSVKENLDFFGKMYNVSSKTLQHRIIELTDLLDLKEHINKPAGSLSLGLQQRLSFCCALLHYPEIVFLDEPTSGVDPMTRKDFWKLLLGLANHNITMIVTTHFLDEAQYCDRALMLLSGSPIALGSPSDLIQQAKKFQNQVHSMEDVFLAHLNHYEKMEHA